ncbi:MAG: DNA-binding response regulator [Shackletoniella antarctica]|jgi:DNA-binding response OmpR family regulator|uniref:DNA-binding response regulator n=1 Tax=Shackletoniella antarctica TaxID=268115 RepID=A0A2W4WDC1_9CYAN|nr:MAG: DNA-binding response regulator [Shackletoniella antarctica]
MAKHILLIENESSFSRLIESELIQESYLVSVFKDGFSGLFNARQIEPDALIISSSISDLTAIDICRRLRTTGNPVPILYIDKDTTPQKQAAALEAGADAYVTTPINLDLILAYMKVFLRKNDSENTSRILVFSDMTLSHHSRTVYRGGHELTLTAKEFDLLAYFLEHPKEALKKSQIIDAVWGYDCDLGLESNVLQFYICSLRKKIEDGQKERLIHTIRGFGYILKAAAKGRSRNSLSLALA